VERFVVLGLEEGDRVQVVEGLEVGEKLVVKGQHLLADGDLIDLGQPTGKAEAAAAKTAEQPAAPPAQPATPTEG
jgi:hypothetical protein